MAHVQFVETIQKLFVASVSIFLRHLNRNEKFGANDLPYIRHKRSVTERIPNGRALNDTVILKIFVPRERTGLYNIIIACVTVPFANHKCLALLLLLHRLYCT